MLFQTLASQEGGLISGIDILKIGIYKNKKNRFSNRGNFKVDIYMGRFRKKNKIPYEIVFYRFILLF